MLIGIYLHFLHFKAFSPQPNFSCTARTAPVTAGRIVATPFFDDDDKPGIWNITTCKNVGNLID